MFCHGQRRTHSPHPMQVEGSMTTSIRPRDRVIAPVGQPIRHTGSV